MAQIHLQVHPPERRKAYNRSTVCAGCTCCCCCCAHSLGGVIGAIVGGHKAAKDESISDKETVSQIVGTYWLSIVGLLLFFSLVAMLFFSPELGLTVALLFLLYFPIVQLFVSIVIYIRIMVSMSNSKRTAAFKTMNKITLKAITGALIGGLLMAAIAVMIANA